MPNYDFILAGLRDEAVSAVPNVRMLRVPREHKVGLLRELKRIGVGGTVDERLHEEIERPAREFIDLCGETATDAVSTTASISS